MGLDCEKKFCCQATHRAITTEGVGHQCAAVKLFILILEVS